MRKSLQMSILRVDKTLGRGRPRSEFFGLARDFFFSWACFLVDHPYNESKEK